MEGMTGFVAAMLVTPYQKQYAGVHAALNTYLRADLRPPTKNRQRAPGWVPGWDDAHWFGLLKKGANKGKPVAKTKAKSKASSDPLQALAEMFPPGLDDLFSGAAGIAKGLWNASPAGQGVKAAKTARSYFNRQAGRTRGLARGGLTRAAGSRVRLAGEHAAAGHVLGGWSELGARIPNAKQAEPTIAMAVPPIGSIGQVARALAERAAAKFGEARAMQRLGQALSKAKAALPAAAAAGGVQVLKAAGGAKGLLQRAKDIVATRAAARQAAANAGRVITAAAANAGGTVAAQAAKGGRAWSLGKVINALLTGGMVAVGLSGTFGAAQGAAEGGRALGKALPTLVGVGVGLYVLSNVTRS